MMRALSFGGRARGEKGGEGFLTANQGQIVKFEGGGGDCGDFFPAGNSFGSFFLRNARRLRRGGCGRIGI